MLPKSIILTSCFEGAYPQIFSFYRIFTNGTPGGNRTPNRRIWNPKLYQLSYRRVRMRKNAEIMELAEGLEPPTYGLQNRCSTN